MMCLEVCRVVTPRVVAHFEVPADQQADGRCSCVRCGECEPSIILKREEHETIEFLWSQETRIVVR
jgi:hypothetical protein